MQQGSTLLKVVSIILIVFGAFGIIMGLMGLVGGGVLAGSGVASQATGSTLAVSAGGEISGSDADKAALGIGLVMIVGIMGLVSGIVDLVIGIVGLKASKENGKHTGAFVLGIIGVVLAVISLIASFSAGGDLATSVGSGLVGLILPILYLVGVNQTRQGVVM